MLLCRCQQCSWDRQPRWHQTLSFSPVQFLKVPRGPGWVQLVAHPKPTQPVAGLLWLPDHPGITTCSSWCKTSSKALLVLGLFHVWGVFEQQGISASRGTLWHTHFLCLQIMICCPFHVGSSATSFSLPAPMNVFPCLLSSCCAAT